jgi:putative ABC transport system ATP-binding protein
LTDEPTGNLDSASAREVLGLLRAARDRGQTLLHRTLLHVTHDARVAAAADRVVGLRDGLVFDETELCGGLVDRSASTSGSERSAAVNPPRQS